MSGPVDGGAGTPEGGRARREALISSVAHALKGPLQTLVGLADLLQEGKYGELSSEQEAVVARVLEKSEELVRRMDSVVALVDLTLGGGEGGERETPVRPSAVADAATSRLAAEMRERTTTVRNRIPAEYPAVGTGPSRLLRLFQTLVRCVTLEAGTPGGEVTIRSWPPREGRGRFAVSWAAAGEESSASAWDAGPDVGAASGDRPGEAKPFEAGPGALELVVALGTLGELGGELELLSPDPATAIAARFTLPCLETAGAETADAS